MLSQGREGYGEAAGRGAGRGAVTSMMKKRQSRTLGSSHLIPDELCFARLPQLLCLREEKIWSHRFLHGDAEVERLAVRILKTLLRPGYGEKRA